MKVCCIHERLGAGGCLAGDCVQLGLGLCEKGGGQNTNH